MKNGMWLLYDPPSFDLVIEFPHQATSIMRRELLVLKNIFMQLGTIKTWFISEAAIDLLAGVLHLDGRGAAVALMVSDD